MSFNISKKKCWKAAFCSFHRPFSIRRTSVSPVSWQKCIFVSVRIHCGGIVHQYLQQSHLKVPVDALHVAQDPLPIRTARPQHLLHRLRREHFKYVRHWKRHARLYEKTHQGSPECVRSQPSLLFWTPDWDSPSGRKRMDQRAEDGTTGDWLKLQFLPCSLASERCTGRGRGGRCGRRRRRPDRRPSCCWNWWCQYSRKDRTYRGSNGRCFTVVNIWYRHGSGWLFSCEFLAVGDLGQQGQRSWKK